MTLEIDLLPFEGVPPSDLAHLVGDLAALGVRAHLRAALPLPAEAYDPRRQQYRADRFLRQARVAGGDRPVLAVTDRDLYAHGLNFVFGMAESTARAAVISLHRLRFNADAVRFRTRTVKEAMHELGHVLGLGHCPNPACVMHFSNSLADTDRKGPTPCARCHARGALPV